MNKAFKPLTSITFFLLATSLLQASDEVGCHVLMAGQAAFYQHSNYQGKCAVRNIGRYASAKAIGMGNDKVSSIKLGRDTLVSLCYDKNFKGGCTTYSKSMASLAKMNDKTSSATVRKTPPPRKPPVKRPPVRNPPPYVYEKNTETPIITKPPRTEGKFDLNAPSHLNADYVTGTTVYLTWVDNSDKEFGVEVYRIDPVKARQTKDVTWEFVGLFQERIDSKVKGTGSRTDEDHGLDPNTNYCYKLRAYYGFDRKVVSDYSKSTCIKTTASKRPKVTVKRR